MSDQPDRPKVGPADAKTRREFLDRELNKPSRAEGVAPKPKAEKPKKAPVRRYGPKGKTEREITDEAEKGETMQSAIQRGIDDAKSSRE